MYTLSQHHSDMATQYRKEAARFLSFAACTLSPSLSRKFTNQANEHEAKAQEHERLAGECK